MRLIIVDGLDGVGKDTHAQFVRQRYEEKGERVVLRSHPESDNFFGRTTKKALLGSGPINKAKAAIFYMLDVLHSVKVYYNKKDINTLIMVRYLMGTAYLSPFLSKIAYRFFAGLVPTSSYMFFLDASPEELLSRVQQRQEIEMFENIEELTKVRKKALMLAQDWNIVDTNSPVEQTAIRLDNLLSKLDRSM